MKQKMLIFSLAVLVVAAVVLVLTLGFNVSIFPLRSRTIALFIGIPLALMGLFGVCFFKLVEKHCRISTTLIAWGLSLCVGLGCRSFLSVFTITALYDDAALPLAVGCTAFCALSFCALYAVYYLVRRKNPSIEGVMIDIGYAIVSLPVSLSIGDIAAKMVSSVL